MRIQDLILMGFGLVVASSSLAQSQDTTQHWSQWRGPLANGVAPKGDPPTEWSETKNIRWKVAIPGRGHAAPIVWGDRVYVLTAIKKDRAAGVEPQESVRVAMAQETPPPQRPRGERPRSEKPSDALSFTALALDRGTGKTIWQKTLRESLPHEGTHTDATFASASPITDGEHVFAYFGSHGLYCLGLDGVVKWELDLGDMRTRNSFGEGSSPALHENTLVVNWDHEDEDFIVALDKKTGKELWRKSRDEPTGWATPLIVAAVGKPQVILPGTNRIRGYDLATGETVWETSGLTANVIPSPVFGEGLVYLMSGFRGAALKAVKLAEARGDISESSSALAWSYDKDTPYVPSPLLYDDTLYFLENNRPVLTCLNARTGEKLFGPERLEALQGVYASPVGAAGRVYIAGRDGTTVVLKRGPKFEILATNKLDEGFDASPGIAGKELFLRDQEHLYCIAAP